MKQLFWKEWRELRLLLPAAMACVFLLILLAVSLTRRSGPDYHFAPGDTITLLLGTWMLVGLIAGATLFAPEVGGGTLQFLSALPISRRRLWAVKVLTALGVLLASVLASALAWAVTDAFVFQSAFFHAPFWHTLTDSLYPLRILLMVPIFFMIALAVSPFLDRSVSAIVAALFVSLSYLVLVQSLAQEYANHFEMTDSALETVMPPTQRAAVVASLRSNSLLHLTDQTIVAIVFLVLSLFIFPAISYWTFTRGESLRSAKRFRVGALAGVVSLGVAGLLFLAGYGLQLW